MKILIKKDGKSYNITDGEAMQIEQVWSSSPNEIIEVQGDKFIARDIKAINKTSETIDAERSLERMNYLKELNKKRNNPQYRELEEQCYELLSLKAQAIKDGDPLRS